MENHNMQPQNVYEYSYNTMKKDFEEFEDEHGTLFSIIFYFACFLTIFLFSYLNPPNFYRKMLSAFFNWKFTWREAKWKVYHVLNFILFCFGLLLFFMKFQSDQFITKKLPMDETHEKRIYRLKFKWLIEGEMWLLTIIIVELMYVSINII
jgi:hypothetical protein